MDDWKSQLVVGRLIHQRIGELDRSGIWDHGSPSEAASDERIRRAKARLGHPLDDKYVRFPQNADGWRNFYQNVSIFGTAELGAGLLWSRAMAQLDEIEPSLVGRDFGVGPHEVTPIAASLEQEDMFLLGKPGTRRAGAVAWMAGEVVDTFPDFDEFYLAMLDYNRRAVAQLDEGRTETIVRPSLWNRFKRRRP